MTATVHTSYNRSCQIHTVTSMCLFHVTYYYNGSLFTSLYRRYRVRVLPSAAYLKRLRKTSLFIDLDFIEGRCKTFLHIIIT